MPSTNTPTLFSTVLHLLAAYSPAILISILFNTIDVYFLQSERKPPLHLSPAFWLFLTVQALVATLAADLLYAKAGATDALLTGFAAALTGFSIVQSFALKIGEHGVDLRTTLDAWKGRVIAGVSGANASKKVRDQVTAARELAGRATQQDLEAAIHLLAPGMKVNAVQMIADFTAQNQVDPKLLMANWIASADIEYARSLYLT